MFAGDWLRILTIVVGLAILIMTTLSLAMKHMTESFCIFWGFVSLLFIVSGILLRPIGWNKYISMTALVIIFLGVFCVLAGGLYLSVRISRVIRQATELAIQVSLLNQENEILLKELTRQNEEYEEKDLIYN